MSTPEIILECFKEGIFMKLWARHTRITGENVTPWSL